MISQEFQALRTVDTSTQELRDRNALRVAEFKEKMGEKFVLHKANSPRKVKAKRILK